MPTFLQKAARKVYSRTGRNDSILSVFLILFILTFSLCCYFGINPISDYFTVAVTWTHNNFHEPCILPELNPFDSTMMKNQKLFKPIECKRCEPLIHIDGTNRIVFNKTFIIKNGISTNEIICECNDVIRADADNKIVWGDTYKCPPPFDVKADFFKVVCISNGKVVYDDILTAIFRKKTQSKPSNGYYNVFMVGIDSMSRPVAMRQLKRTLQYMDEELDAFTYKGYVKVGSNTFPNIIPLLTGRQAYTKELPDLRYFDTYPLIWKKFSEANYVTLYAEDTPVLNAFNIAGRKGFVSPPTDHYMRPFWLAWNKEYPVRDYNMGFGFKLLKNDFFKSKTQQYTLCAGNSANVVAHLHYLKQFIQTYQQEQKFIFAFNTELGHYNENFLNLADDDLYSFVKGLNLKQSNDTIFIFFSDHGQKVSENYLTVRLEQNLPFLSIVLPKHLRKMYPNLSRNMKENTKRLTTHYDLHATLLDIVDRNFDSPGKFTVGGKVRGSSLFGEISSERSCADASVPEHMCICYQSRKIEDSDLEQRLAESVVDKLNSILAAKKACAFLSLKAIINLQEVVNNQRVSPPRSTHVIRSKLYIENFKKYTIIIRTDPSGGEFLATCKVHSESNIEVLNDIDRINIYGNQSYCVTEPNLKPLCFCKG